jgi:transcriptional regulator with XRE-family HTH domain
MGRTLTLREKVEILFEYGQARGLSVAYLSIAQATGENASNIRKIHLGINTNPGIKTFTKLAEYFGVGLAYFDCQTKAECQRFLGHVGPERVLSGIALRASGISEEGLDAIKKMIDYVRKSEGLPPANKK